MNNGTSVTVTCLHEGTNDWEDNSINVETCPCLCKNCMAFQEYMLGPPCPDCVHARTCEACKAEDAYYEYMAKRVELLGEELAMLPDFMECYECGRNPLMLLTPRRLHEGDLGFNYVWRKPVGLGPIAEAHRDPTQTYRLECGHGAM